jgi:regulatory protein
MRATTDDSAGQEIKLTLTEAKAKIAKYCAYQERAHSEVKQKLYSYNLFRDEVEEILAWLITENYLNEERYATTVAGGKFRIKKWGRLKISQYLKQKDVSTYSIDKALGEINQEMYQRTMNDLILQKKDQTKAANIYELRHKVARHLIGKGYEPEEVWKQIKQIIVN